MSELDPVVLAVLKGRLEQIADEMDATLFAPPSIRSSPRRATRAMGSITPRPVRRLCRERPVCRSLSARWRFAVRAVIEKSTKQGDLADGDVYIFNDPYEGGTHLSDFKLVRPFFRNGRVFCWLASVGTGTTSVGTCPETTIRSQPNAFRREC